MNEKKVIVEILNQISDIDLEMLLETHLNNGYRIQDSQINWYCGKIEGVYVFIKKEEGING